MTRYIDAEKLKADEKRISSLPWGDWDGNKVDFTWTPEEVQRLIDKAPTADVVEVVRCKDCKHKGGNGYDEDVCWEIENQHGVYVSDNWFCADGERRE